MKRKDLEQTLIRTLHQPPVTVNEQHFAATCRLAGMQAHQKQARRRITFLPFLSMQIRYIGWKIWLAQSIFLLLTGCILNRIYGIDHLNTPLHLAKLLSCLSVLVFMSALPPVYRSARYRMQEVEAAARFSSATLLMAKLIIIGAGDLFILSGIFCITIWKASLRADSVILYLCFPFLLGSSCCLFLLGHLPPGQFFAASIMLCSFLILAAATLSRHAVPPFYNSFSSGWIAVCMILAAFNIRQFRYILYGSSYTELQLS